MSLIKHNNPIYYVDIQNSTRWDIKYVDISNAPYKFMEYLSDSHSQSDVLNNFILNKRITEQVSTQETVDLLCVFYRDFLEEVYNSESLSLGFATGFIEEYSLDDSVSLLCNWTLSEETFEVSDSTTLNISPVVIDETEVTHSDPIFSFDWRLTDSTDTETQISFDNSIIISDQSFQDYTESDYFYWDVVDELDYNYVYNNTLGSPDKYQFNDYVALWYKNPITSNNTFGSSDSINLLGINKTIIDPIILQESVSLLCNTNVFLVESFQPQDTRRSLYSLFISDQNYQDYVDGNYFYLDTNTQDYNNVYINTLGTSDKVTIQDTVAIRLNGILI